MATKISHKVSHKKQFFNACTKRHLELEGPAGTDKTLSLSLSLTLTLYFYLNLYLMYASKHWWVIDAGSGVSPRLPI